MDANIRGLLHRIQNQLGSVLRDSVRHLLVYSGVFRGR